jgi:hypothetical protein
MSASARFLVTNIRLEKRVVTDSTGKLIYSTYLGGSSQDQPQQILVDPQGNAVVLGFTHSLDFPAVNPLPSAGYTPPSTDVSGKRSALSRNSIRLVPSVSIRLCFGATTPRRPTPREWPSTRPSTHTSLDSTFSPPRLR